MSIAQFSLHSQGCHDKERRALLSFKSALEDPSDRLSSWQDGNTYRNCCNWQGIGCSYDTFRVISINLHNTKLEKYMNTIEFKGYQVTSSGIQEPPPNTSLIGKISPSLLKLTHLEYLDFSFNNFEIPFQLSTLTKLVHLDLSHSILSSSISTQFNNLSSLQYLDLSSAIWPIYPSKDNFGTESFGDIQSTQWLRELTNLQVLKWSRVDLFSAIYSSKHNFGVHISYLSSLTYLDLSDCRIDGLGFLFQGLHNFSRLSTLIMYSNYLSNLHFPQLSNLTSLSTLDLSSCELQISVPYLPQLKELDVSNNHNLRTDLTRMFQHQWPQLEKLSISETNTSGSIISLSNAPMLVSLSASSCSIQGSLPSSIYNLSQLQFLDLSYNSITGSIHSSVSNLKHLQIFDVSYNNIQGSIQKSICEILSLRQLVLDGNNMTGTIPDCITKLHNLDIFSVSGNSFGGTVSLINFMNEMNLTTLGLGSNRLTVIVDQNFHLYSDFLKLKSLVLKSCNISGLFPSFICELRYLNVLDLSRNNMTGPIPSCISKLKIASIFDLSNNKFSGQLIFPPRGSFDISHNNLSGTISIETGKKLSKLNSIILAGNELSGSIPFSICSKVSQSNPTFIDLSENKLSGIIPTSIGYCNELYFLNLGSNNLSGNVPNELERASRLGFLQLHGNNLNGAPLNIISKLQYLQVLNLANNHFRGKIPIAFGSIELLSVLSLRSNMFNGSIPEGIFNLHRLQILDLSQNNFSGHIPKILGIFWRFVSYYSINQTYISPYYNIQLQMVINGVMVRFENIYNYSSGIDLSHNMLDGSIPKEIGLLNNLAMLNLSHNLLSNNIPAGVGNMSSLGTLDLSFNRLSGHIPQSLTSLDFLGFLNLSYNEFSGRIPRGNHFDTLSVDGSAFLGNNLLCGPPLKKICDGDQVVDSSGTSLTYNVEEGDQDDAEERILFFGIIALGFIVGFWGLFFVLLMEKDKLWFPYWRFIDSVVVKITHKLYLE